MFIKYSPKIPHIKIIPLIATGDSTFDNDTVTLRPGINELTKEQWEAIKPHIKRQIENKEISPFSVPVKDKKSGKTKKAGTLRDVPVATARKIIMNCNDPKTLKKWFNQELPDELALILNKRMRNLKVEPDSKLEDTDIDLNGEITEEGDDIEPKTDTGDDDLDNGDDTDTDSESEEDEDEEGDDDETEEDEDDIPDFDGSKGSSKE